MKQGNIFGGAWTETKLEIVRRYFSMYATALKFQPFKRLYMDAFAGTGTRTGKRAMAQMSLDFEELDEMKKGSARIALEVKDPFDHYLLIEKNRHKARQLEQLRQSFPGRSIEVIPADANAAIQEMCGRYDWRRNRAFLFLDPFGLQVTWETLRAVAATRAIDTWILFPSGIALGRMLTRNGKITAAWEKRLNVALGTDEWREEFYPIRESLDLLGPRVERVREVSPEKVEAFYLRRLRTIFADVAPNSVHLMNSRRNVMYLLCFAVGNPKGAPLALRFAKEAMKA
jgi:three-Cys-motif partner protein